MRRWKTNFFGGVCVIATFALLTISCMTGYKVIGGKEMLPWGIIALLIAVWGGWNAVRSENAGK